MKIYKKAAAPHAVLNEYRPGIDQRIVEKFQQSDLSLGKGPPAVIIIITGSVSQQAYDLAERIGKMETEELLNQ